MLSRLQIGLNEAFKMHQKSRLEALRNALYNLLTYLLTYLQCNF